jgi:hypothetical protein
MALFVEPAAPYAAALTLSMTDALLAMIADGTGPSNIELHRLSHWLAQSRFVLLFPDADKSAIEDKHAFYRDDLAFAAEEAGFDDLTILPWHFDPLGLEVLSGVLHGVGISSGFAGRFFPIYERFAKRHFQPLSKQDKSSMYVIALHCSASSPLNSRPQPTVE